MIDLLVAAGHPVLTCCRILGVSKPGYYRYKHRPTSPTKMRREWLSGLIREVHLASRGTYGYRRVHAELTMGMDVSVSSRLVFTLMHDAGLYGLPGPTRIKRLRGVVTADDLVNRKFHRMKPTSCGSPTCAPTQDAGRLAVLLLRPGRLQPQDRRLVHRLQCRHPTRTERPRHGHQDPQPRKTLGWKTPTEAFNEQLLLLQQGGVASTG